MKKVLFIAALAVASFSVKAQDDSKPLTFSVGAELALPVGDFVDNNVFNIKFNDIYSFGAGLSFQGKYSLDESLGLTLSAGYISYFEKEYQGSKPGSLGVIPVLAGIEYNFTPQVFAGAQLGYSIYTGKLLSDNDYDMSGFSYVPSIGYRFTPNFSAALKYQASSVKIKDGSNSEKGNLSHIGLRLAYSF